MNEDKIQENAKIISSFDPFTEKTYRDMDLDRLIVYSLRRLEGKNIPLYFDLITAAAFRLFPKKFSMAAFPQYPDTNRTNKAVRRLTDPKRKNWATGNVENGFYLTELGREIAEEVEVTLANPDRQQKTKPATRSRGRSSEDDTKEVHESDLFKQWQESGSASPHEFFAFLRATPYTPKALLSEHLKQLKQSAADADDKEVLRFLEWVNEKFGNLTSES